MTAHSRSRAVHAFADNSDCRMPRSRIALVVSSLLMMGLLAGCTAPDTDAAPSPSRPEPTQTPTFEPAADPTSRFSFDCDDIGVAISALHSVELPVSSTIPTADGRASWLQGPGQYTFAHSGNLYCEFGDQRDLDSANAKVILVAGGEAAMADRVETIGPGQEMACSIQTGGGNCGYLGVVNDVYIELQAMGVAADDEAEAVALTRAAAAELETLADASVSLVGWAPPSGTVALGADCDAILPRDELGRLVGQPSLDVLHPEGGWGLEAWMLTSVWSAEPCSYFPEGSSPWASDATGTGGLTWLPGGEWAYTQSVVGEPVVIDTTSPMDRAVLDCSTPIYYVCAVDILAGRNWVRFAMYEEDAAAQMQLAVGVAQVVIDTVRG